MKLDELRTWEEVLEERLGDPDFRAEWERLAPARAVANRLVLYRADHNLSQSALGRILGMSQPAVARLEAADHLPSLQTLLKLSEALGFEILVSMAPSSGHEALDPEPRQARVVERTDSPRGTSLTIAIR